MHESSLNDGRFASWSAMLLQDHGFLRLGFRNRRRVSDQLFCANQPLPHQIKDEARRGIKTILNLRGVSPKSYYQLEKEACAKYGLNLVDFQVKSREAPTREGFHEAKRLFETIAYPALMHCKSGADRTGIMGVFYRLVIEEAPLDDALEQLSLRYLHVKAGKTGVLDHVFETYRTQGLARGMDFMTWVDEVYDPDAVMRDFRSTWWGSAITEGVFSRE